MPNAPPQKQIVNSIGMKLALIPAGTFLMGSPDSELGRCPDEGPQHEVTISRPFYLSIHPVTQREYQTVMGVNPACFMANLFKRNPGHPVEQVSWDEAVDFCQRLSSLAAEKHAGRVYRLPTEAEWEYACRAGTTTPFHFGTSLFSIQANIDYNRNRTTKVGSYPPNAWGLYDMHGNVWEWCRRLVRGELLSIKR